MLLPLFVTTTHLLAEMCLTSNLKVQTVTSYDEHHLGYWYSKKHPLIICVSTAYLLSVTVLALFPDPQMLGQGMISIRSILYCHNNKYYNVMYTINTCTSVLFNCYRRMTKVFFLPHCQKNTPLQLGHFHSLQQIYLNYHCWLLITFLMKILSKS